MTFSDRDLAAALAPLAGDPKADRERLLAALPKGPPPVPPANPWGPVLLGIALGFLLGYFTGRSLKPGATEPGGIPPVRKPVTPETKPAGPEMLAVLGNVEGFGTRKELDRYSKGDSIKPGTWVQSSDASRAAIRVGAGFEVHMDERTSLRLEAARSLLAKEGRFYLSVQEPQGVTLKLADGVEIVATDAEFVATSGAAGVSLATLRGIATIAIGKQSRVCKAGNGCAFDLKGGLGEPKPFGPAESLVAWQAELLLAMRR